jgi:hypothetical protein
MPKSILGVCDSVVHGNDLAPALMKYFIGERHKINAFLAVNLR